VVTAASANPGEHSPSQQARLDRLREPSSTTALSTRLADQIAAACDDIDRVQLLSVTARDDKEMAWLTLCDRGWPHDGVVEALDLTPSFAWLAAWSEFVSLPPEITSPLDRSKLRWIEERLTQCEAPLQIVLPAAVWLVVGPLDRTGRATLACMLQSLIVFVNAQTHFSAAESRRHDLLERFALYRQQARKLGVRAPLAALDVRAWRATALAVRAIRE
jgi:hypothetical protein